MAQKIDDGGPAFPLNTTNDPNEGAFYPHGGMSLRDYFAAAALSGAVASPHCPSPDFDEHAMARACFELADAMIAERTRRTGGA